MIYKVKVGNLQYNKPRRTTPIGSYKVVKNAVRLFLTAFFYV